MNDFGTTSEERQRLGVYKSKTKSDEFLKNAAKVLTCGDLQ